MRERLLTRRVRCGECRDPPRAHCAVTRICTTIWRLRETSRVDTTPRSVPALLVPLLATVTHSPSGKRSVVSVVKLSLAAPLSGSPPMVRLGSRARLNSVCTSTVTGALPPKAKELVEIAVQNCERLVRLAEEAESAMRELRDLRRGRVLIGANEAAVHTLLPLIGHFREGYPDIAIDVRRVPARQIAVEVQQGSLDFGALTFRPSEPGLLEVAIGTDELVLLVPPAVPSETIFVQL